MSKISQTIVIALTVASCFGYEVKTIENDGPYKYVYRMSENFLPENDFAHGSYGNFQICGEVRVSYDTLLHEYGLVVGGLVENGFYIQADSSLELNIDGEKFLLDRQKTPYRLKEVMLGRKKYFLEMAWYNTDKHLLEKLALATKVTYRVRGKNKYIGGVFSETNISNFQKFLKEYVIK